MIDPARFEIFHREHPEVYELFTRFALQVAATGRGRFSARAIFHRIRWFTAIETNDPDGFKINSIWSPFYARMFEQDHPELAGFFEKRKASADVLLEHESEDDWNGEGEELELF